MSASRSGSGTRPPTAPTMSRSSTGTARAGPSSSAGTAASSNWINPTYTRDRIHDVQFRFFFYSNARAPARAPTSTTSPSSARRRPPRAPTGPPRSPWVAEPSEPARAEAVPTAPRAGSESVDRLDARRAAAGAARVRPRAAGPGAAGGLRRGRPPGRAARGCDAVGRIACLRVAGRGRARGVLGRLLRPARRQRRAGHEPDARAREVATQRAAAPALRGRQLPHSARLARLHEKKAPGTPVSGVFIGAVVPHTRPNDPSGRRPLRPSAAPARACPANGASRCSSRRSRCSCARSISSMPPTTPSGGGSVSISRSTTPGRSASRRATAWARRRSHRPPSSRSRSV